MSLFGFGWVILAFWLPPISPNLDAEAVAQIFREHNFSFLLASVCIMLSTLLLFPLAALTILIMQKIEGRTGMLTWMLALTWATYLVQNFYTGLSFNAAAFRMDRSPEAIQLAMDSGFLSFMGGIPMFMMLWVVVAFGILAVQPKDNPILPRWWGYFNIWTTILFLPELLMYFFKTGIFAWDGFVGFWIPVILFILYFGLGTPIYLRAIKDHF